MRIAGIVAFALFIMIVAGVISIVLMILAFSFGFMSIDISNVASMVEWSIFLMILLLGFYVLFIYAPTVIRRR